MGIKFVEVELPKFDFFNIPNKGVSRQELSSVFDESADYLFLKTTANPEAVKALEDCSVTLGYCFDSLEGFKKMYGCMRNPEDLKNLRYNSSVNGLYVNSLRELSRKLFGDCYVSYNLVQTANVHNLDRPVNSVYWPVVHVLKNFEDSASFNSLVQVLNGDESFNIIKKWESPQNYRMGEVKKLREMSINPLILCDAEWAVKGTVLKQAVDFLVPFTLRHEFDNSTPFD